MDRYSFTVEVAGDAKAYDRYEQIVQKTADDALLAMVDGKIFIDFDRYAASYDTAVRSAIHDLENEGVQIVDVIPIF